MIESNLSSTEPDEDGATVGSGRIFFHTLPSSEVEAILFTNLLSVKNQLRVLEDSLKAEDTCKTFLPDRIMCINAEVGHNVHTNCVLSNGDGSEAESSSMLFSEALFLMLSENNQFWTHVSIRTFFIQYIRISFTVSLSPFYFDKLIRFEQLHKNNTNPGLNYSGCSV